MSLTPRQIKSYCEALEQAAKHNLSAWRRLPLCLGSFEDEQRGGEPIQAVGFVFDVAEKPFALLRHRVGSGLETRERTTDCRTWASDLVSGVGNKFALTAATSLTF